MKSRFFHTTYRETNPLARPSVRVTTDPICEPITLTEVKNNLNLSSSQTEHDGKLTLLIQAAREEWEHDTSRCCINRTIEQRQEFWDEKIRLLHGPINSITSVRYYDSNNTLQTVSAADYSIDYTNNEIQFQRLYSEPASFDRWDAWVITYVAGYGTVPSAVPALDKQAMIMHVTNEFENTGETDAYLKGKTAYESLVAKKMRSTYP